MKKSLVRSRVVIAATATVGTAFAQQLKPEEMIQFRQAGYKFMAWNMGKIKTQAVDGTVPFNKDQVLAAARGIQAVANSGMGALYAAGTDKDIGAVKTRAKPEIFDPANAEERNKIGGNFVQQANKLAEVAAGGDAAAIKVAFGDMGKACKACHDKFRKDEEKK
jgi:cytochrome c556